MAGGFPTPQAELDYIRQKAAALNLDPGAVLAVAAHEGGTLPAQVGDSGTSFGPWQLHAGGALPAAVWQRGPDYSRSWADSQQGIDYALTAISRVASGRRGQDAIRAIVYDFERPKDPANETVYSIATYNQGGGPTLGSGSGSVGAGIGRVAGDIGNAPSAVAGAITGPFHSLTDFYNFVTSWRFAEVVGGFLLLLVGLWLLGRQFGVSMPVPTPVGAAGSEVAKAAGPRGPARRRRSEPHFESAGPAGPPPARTTGQRIRDRQAAGLPQRYDPSKTEVPF